MNKNIINFIGCDSEYEEAKVVLFGAPFDGTTSFRPGTRFAPPIIRNESYGLEEYSPYLDVSLEDYSIFDAGDLEFPFGNKEKVLKAIEDFTKKIIKDNKIPFMIGGEHLVSYGTIKALAEKYKDLHIIHFDAHTDLREDYLGEPLSHATVMKRAWEIVGDNKIFQFGIRSGTKEEFQWAKTHVSKQNFKCDSILEVVKKLQNKPVYITIDLDVLDPSFFSGTGTLEPGGITYKELQDAIVKMSKLNNVVGFDIVELSPHYDPSGASTAVACKVVRELLLAVLKN